MKVIKEFSYLANVARTYDKKHTLVRIFVTESATNFYITIRVSGYALPSVEAWKVSKKEAGNDFKKAANIIINEATKRGNL